MSKEYEALKQMYYIRMIEAESVLKYIMNNDISIEDARAKADIILDKAEALVKKHVSEFKDE